VSGGIVLYLQLQLGIVIRTGKLDVWTMVWWQSTEDCESECCRTTKRRN